MCQQIEKKRLSLGDNGVNPLDIVFVEHDIAYSKSNNLDIRHKADKILEKRNQERITAADSSSKEKIVTYTVMNTIKSKQKIGVRTSVAEGSYAASATFFGPID
ncbi:Uncharacterized protein FWK35_00020845 [Aphis craccivora]|uniref:Uncharacterized protein n=1 Tax=Aphis craccivora TaxID=307492 RepID=A0A6G0WU03_APHCR|nr:Uncharacterized protein FWK35_00020845 [Aphis craccivora]